MSNDEILGGNWRDFEYAVVDLEGTGAQHRDKEGIVDIAVVRVRSGLVTEERFSRLLDPGIKIPMFISRIHGIYDRDVKGRPVFDSIANELEAFLGGRFLVAHNAPVERRVLALKLPSYKPPLIFDTLKMARKIYGSESKHGLDDLMSRLSLHRFLADIETTSHRHSALYDAVATAHAFVHMAHQHLGGGAPLRELVELCALEGVAETKDQTNTPPEQSTLDWES